LNLNTILGRVKRTLRYFVLDMTKTLRGSPTQCILLFGPTATLNKVLPSMEALEELVLPEQALFRSSQPIYDKNSDDPKQFQKVLYGKPVNNAAWGSTSAMLHHVDGPMPSLLPSPSSRNVEDQETIGPGPTTSSSSNGSVGELSAPSAQGLSAATAEILEILENESSPAAWM
jgi:hypothetical protein